MCARMHSHIQTYTNACTYTYAYIGKFSYTHAHRNDIRAHINIHSANERTPHPLWQLRRNVRGTKSRVPVRVAHTHSLTHSLTYHTHLFTHPLIHSLTHSLTHHTHSLTHSLIHSFACSYTQTLTPLLSHSYTYTLT